MTIKEGAMIYLVGGTPHSGKSTVATRLARRLRISCIATDTIESVVLQLYTRSRDIRRLFPKTWIRRQARTSTSNDILFGKTPPRIVVQALIRQSRAVWAAVEVLIACEIGAGRDIVVEGYHVHPELVSILRDKYGKKNVRAVFLVRRNRESTIRFCSLYPARGRDWFVQKTGAHTNLENIGSMIVLFSRFLDKEARKHHCRVISTDVQYKKQIRDAVDLLAK